MALNLSNLKLAPGSKKGKKRLGRGNASGHGTYSARGLKGQRSRSGGRGGLKLKGMKSRLQKIPKLRGFKSHYKKPEIINLAILEKIFSENTEITPKRLRALGLIGDIKNGVKILGKGKLTKKITVKGCSVSTKVREQIERVGGRVL